MFKFLFKKLPYIGALFFAVIISYVIFYHQAFDFKDNNGHQVYYSKLSQYINDSSSSVLERAKSDNNSSFIHIIKFANYILNLGNNYSAILILTFAFVFLACSIYFIFKKSLKDTYNNYFYLALTFITLLLSSIYAPFFIKNDFIDKTGINVWNNPILIIIKPFAFLGIYYFVSAFNEENRKKREKNSYTAAILLFLSVWIMPNFILAFIPAVFVYLLVKYKKNLFDTFLRAFLILFPSLYLLNEKFMIVDEFSYWGWVFDGFLLSFFLAVLFPLVLTLIYFEFAKNGYLFISWLILISGAVFFCLFRNSVIVDDWALGFQIGAQNLFIYSTILFLKILATNREKIKFFTFNAIFLGLVFFMHFLAGSYYFLKIFYGTDSL